jgi:hypothetical protein
MPDLTPPTKAAKAPKTPKEPKAPKAAKEPADPNAPKKERAPRTDYGYSKDAIIATKEGETKYRGKRKEWYDSLVAANGKTVAEWEEGRKAAGEKDPPRGWLRFFVQEETVTLSKATV